MKGKEILFSKKSDEWETPQNLFDELNEEFNFDTDLAANICNSKCDQYFYNIDLGINSLMVHYGKDAKKLQSIWCNPPYSNQRKFVEFVIKHKLNSVFLLPARTDTKLFHELIYPWSKENRYPPNLIMLPGLPNENITPMTEVYRSPYQTEIRFIKGRLKFKPSKELIKEFEQKLLEETKPSKIESLKLQIAGEMPAGFPSMIVVFRFD